MSVCQHIKPLTYIYTGLLCWVVMGTYEYFEKFYIGSF
ncbi:hypothetical protein IMCC1989_1292 [gamma proteobacterium IMCC1989]|nr:hypothetical protein IMCC1989_1292 [gamma proteobacterium IMCC1989]